MGKFNIFRFLKIDKSEVISSQFIVSVINTKPEYFNLFLKEINCEGYVQSENCKVLTEVTLKHKSGNSKYGRADIWIGEGLGKERKRIIIENKLDASDQWKQLKRYRNYLDESGANRKGKLFYLSLQSKPASTQSSRGNNNLGMKSTNADMGYQRISYHKHIINWLKEVVEDVEKNNADLSVVIRQFIEIIEEFTTVQKMVDDNKDISEIRETKLKKEFQAALELHFWTILEEKIENSFNNNDDSEFFDSRRKYSYDKIFKFYRDKKIARAYGLIHKNIRIQTYFQNNRQYLNISDGSFDNSNKWVKNGGQDENFNFELLSIANRSDAEAKAEIVLEKFKTPGDKHVS
jgi:hypothetical protein